MPSLRCAIYFIIIPRTRQSSTRFGFHADEHAGPTVVVFVAFAVQITVVESKNGKNATSSNMRNEARCQGPQSLDHRHIRALECDFRENYTMRRATDDTAIHSVHSSSSSKPATVVRFRAPPTLLTRNSSPSSSLSTSIAVSSVCSPPASGASGASSLRLFRSASC